MCLVCNSLLMLKMYVSSVKLVSDSRDIPDMTRVHSELVGVGFFVIVECVDDGIDTSLNLSAKIQYKELSLGFVD